MIDFPITDLFDDSLCLVWLERHLHPDGFVCPTCGGPCLKQSGKSSEGRGIRKGVHHDVPQPALLGTACVIHRSYP